MNAPTFAQPASGLDAGPGVDVDAPLLAVAGLGIVASFARLGSWLDQLALLRWGLGREYIETRVYYS